MTNDPARAPYWMLPETTAGQTLALSGGAGIGVMDCAGLREPFVNEHVLMQLDGSEPRYVIAPTKATVDNYIADECANAAPFSEPLGDIQFGGLTIAIPPPASGSATVYLNLASSFSGMLSQGLTETCDTCAFDQGSCQPLATGAEPVLQGPLRARATLQTYSAVPTPDLVADDINILGQ